MRPEERDPAYLWDMIEAARAIVDFTKNLTLEEFPFKDFHWGRNAFSERGGFSAGLSKNGFRSQMFWRHRHGH